MDILIPIIVLGGLGLVFSFWLMYAHKIFHVEKDPRVERILSILPGINCGACGNAGCEGFALALIKGQADVSGCAPGGAEAQKDLAEFLGVEAKEKIKTTATLICGGGKLCKDKYNYEGVKTCIAAETILGGEKSCQYGCLGYGDCARVCPFNAIRMDENELPVISADKCSACGKCIKICPKKILVMMDAARPYYVNCNSKDKGAVAMKACKKACIACGKCVKACPAGAITILDNLAKIDYEKCTDCGECYKICPTHAINNANLNVA